MTVPTVHLNGTSRQALLDGYQAAYEAVREAYATLQGTYPNGRDYYPQGPLAIAGAMAEHEARLAKLRTVQEELDQLIQAVDQ